MKLKIPNSGSSSTAVDGGGARAGNQMDPDLLPLKDDESRREPAA